MKKFSLIFTMLIAVLLSSCVISSCSSDGDNDESNNGDDSQSSLIVGSWVVKREEFFKNTQLERTYTPYYQYVFKKDGTMIRILGGTPSTDGTYKFNAKNNYLYAHYNSHGTWETEAGDVLKITEDSLIWKTLYDDEEYDYTIAYMTRTRTEYDDPFDETIVESYTGRDKEIIEELLDIRPFIGRWESKNYSYTFYSDKTCSYSKDNKMRYWDYNPTNHIFGITDFSTSWTVTAISPYEWANMNNDSNKSFTLSKLSGYIDSDKKLLVGEWKKSEDTEAVIYFDNQFNYKYKYNGNGRIVSGSGKLNDILSSDEIIIKELTGSSIKIEVPQNGKSQLAGKYIFQNK